MATPSVSGPAQGHASAPVALPSPEHDLAQQGTVVVEERVLRRIIKAHRKLRGVGLQVPHEHCYAIARAELEPLVERADLPVDPAMLPPRVALVTCDRAALATATPETLTRIWRAAFHARVHQAFDELLATSGLTKAAIRERVHRVGQTEFDEIRSVLKQESLLLPPVDDQAIYIEFVALYLELRYFAPHTIARTFPAVFDTTQVDAAIELDLVPAELLAAARPPGAPSEPVVPPLEPVEAVASEPRLEFADPSARKGALRARKKGNRSRAAILAARAGDLPSARIDLEELEARLVKALGGAAAPRAADGTHPWVEALLPVAHSAATRRSLRFDPGARLLHDLQSACSVAEREVKVVDIVGWALSRGKQPLVRPLPATREVRIAKHVHAAEKKIAACGLASREQRDRLADVLHELATRADDQVRAVFRPKIEAALTEVKLEPHSLPERVAEKKLVDEMLDRAVAQGRLTLGDLRDTISGNDLKVADLELAELKTGDQLLRADKILATSLDGVYRRGESYMRGLQKVSSLFFGTKLGRLLTLYVLLPLLGSFAVVEGLQHMVGPLAQKLWGVHPTISSRTTILGGAAFLLLLLHLRVFRDVVWIVTKAIWRAIRFVLWDAPLGLYFHPVFQRFLGSPLVRWLVKPLPPALIVLALVPGIAKWPIAGATFVGVALLVNSRYGRLAEEIAADWAVRSGRQVTSRILPGMVKYVLQLFTQLVELIDRGIYRVDEWLRFRSGQSVVVLFVKGVLGVIWFFITYVLRIYVNLLVEPTVNPIKHFPVVTVAAKIILPFTPAMLSGIAGPSKVLMGSAVGNGFAAFTVLMLPGLAGFLVWELKENWKLYRSTRPKALRSLAIGHHGETVASFLRPGFHSGTIPKHFTKLRRAAWKGDERGVAKQKEGLHHVEEAVAHFADRQLVSMLNEVPAFHATDVALADVEIGSNRIQITLACPSIDPAPAKVRFELQSGFVVANLPERGWTAALRDEQRHIFEIALAGFYKLSAVDIVREQIEQALRHVGEASSPPYDIANEGLVVWPGTGFETEIVYDLRDPRLESFVRGKPYDGVVIDLAGRHALFGREPLYWSVWSTTWQQIARGEQPMKIIAGPPLLPELAR